jgi:hypothetical protein
MVSKFLVYCTLNFWVGIGVFQLLSDETSSSTGSLWTVSIDQKYTKLV